MALFKEKGDYRSTRLEQVVGWIVTLAAAAVVGSFLWRAWFGRS